MQRILSFLLFLLPLSLNLISTEPEAVYLTWVEDPTTTMVIQWISDEDHHLSQVYFQSTSVEDDEWHIAQGTCNRLPEERPFLVHRVDLKGLKPNCTYLFKISGSSEIRRFRTLPKELSEPLPFVVGGDTFRKNSPEFVATCRQAAKQEPLFCILGGDLAYAADAFGLQKERFDRWLEWLRNWSKTMKTAEGRLIPLIAVIGNHDVKRRYNQTPKEAPFFHTLFALPQGSTYRTLDFGSYLSLFLLDSGHCHPVAGKQTTWLKKQLKARSSIPTKIAVYHIPAYPSVRDFSSLHSQTIRHHWTALFEQAHLSMAFEHHDHAYKRTFPLKGGSIDEKGVVYIGDGAWGVDPRPPKTPKELWYLAHSACYRHFILVTLTPKSRLYQAISSDGLIFDCYIQDNHPHPLP